MAVPGRSPDANGAVRACLNAVLQGDQIALDELLSHCWSSVVNYAASITGSPDSAEDVAQETFCRIWARRSELHARGEASAGLIYRIARNLALNHRRSRKRRERHLSLYRETREHDSEHDPQWAEQSELRAAVQAAIAKLPARRREVFTLARFQGLTYAEIAEVLGISSQTVANQMSAALTDLRNTLERFLGDSPGSDHSRNG
jgi:RNA polymerase sigma-70 factor (ECF subfamily)